MPVTWARCSLSPGDAMKSASLELQLISPFGCFLIWFDLRPINFEEDSATPITALNFQMVCCLLISDAVFFGGILDVVI